MNACCSRPLKADCFHLPQIHRSCRDYELQRYDDLEEAVAVELSLKLEALVALVALGLSLKLAALEAVEQE